MKPTFLARKHGCPHCGGIMSIAENQCPFCRQEVSYLTRFEWTGPMGKILLLTAGLTVGMLAGYIFYHIPKPTPGTGIALVAFIWYVLHAVETARNARGESGANRSTGSPVAT